MSGTSSHEKEPPGGRLRLSGSHCGQVSRQGLENSPFTLALSSRTTEKYSDMKEQYLRHAKDLFQKD